MSTRDLAKALRTNIGPQGVVGQDWWGVVTTVNAASYITNMLTAVDSSFETGIGTWTGTTISQSSAKALSGSHSLSVTSTSGGTIVGNYGATTYPVVAGNTYTGMFSVIAATAAQTCAIQIIWLNSGGGVIGSAGSSASVDSAAGWTQYLVTAVAPAGAAYAGLQFYIISTAAGDVHYVDCCALYPGGPYTAWVAGGSNLGVTPNTVTCTINGTTSVVSCRYLATYSPTVNDVVVGRRDAHGDYWAHGNLA